MSCSYSVPRYQSKCTYALDEEKPKLTFYVIITEYDKTYIMTKKTSQTSGKIVSSEDNINYDNIKKIRIEMVHSNSPVIKEPTLNTDWIDIDSKYIPLYYVIPETTCVRFIGEIVNRDGLLNIMYSVERLYTNW